MQCGKPMPPSATTHASDSKPAALMTNLLERWLLFSDYGPRARFCMATAWIGLTLLVSADAIWLAFSHLGFAESNWKSIVRLVLFGALALGLCGLIFYRVENETDRVGRFLRAANRRTELLIATSALFSLLAVAVIAWCCLGTSAALPLQDARLAAIDRWMGFDWPGFVTFVNSSPIVSQLLVKAYQSTPYMLIGTLLWLSVSGQGERLAEFLAISSLTSIGIAVGMMILPAAGAYSYYDLPLGAYDNFGAGSGMWHHDLLMALRTGRATMIDFNVPNSNCLVTFPSGHTVLAIAMTYALRGSLWTLMPAAVVNGAMLVSTIPHGGHHLFDLVVGAAIAAAAISFARLQPGTGRYRLPVAAGIGLANART
jgi:membrane-associated phospholipid phosphatase